MTNAAQAQKKQVIKNFMNNGKGFFQTHIVRGEIALCFMTGKNTCWAMSNYYPIESAPNAILKWNK